MKTECLRIADQLRRAFEGKAWHGPSLKELLADVTDEQACAHPMAAAHSIWELVLHIEVWAKAGLQSMGGVPMPKIVGTVQDWPQVSDPGAAAWLQATGRMYDTMSQLSRAIEQFGDARPPEIVPGRPQYDYYVLFHGIIQHSLYHAGQIALLKKAVGCEQG